MVSGQADQHEHLRRSEERYQKLVDEVVDYAILLLSPEGVIENWNPGAERIKGYKAEEIVGENFRLFYSAEDRARLLPEKLIHEATERGRVAHEGWRVRKDGSVFWGSVVITALHDDSGQVIGFGKVTRDLTERKMAEDRILKYAADLEKKNRELEQFAYAASHDLREPLRKIVSFTDRVMGIEKNLDERTKDYFQRIQKASFRMMALIEGLLSIIQINDREGIQQKTDLNVIINEIIEDLELGIELKKARIIVEPLPQIPAHPIQMRQLFQNLLSNGLKFNNRELPQIKVSAEIIQQEGPQDKPPFCRIYVTDNGIGFEEKYNEKVFELFHRLNGRSEYEGSGLGLALCKKIVENHGGTIMVHSEPGQGSTFTITFPLEAPQT